MTPWIPLLVMLSWKQEMVGGIRIHDLRVPAIAAEGGSALLGCQFDMEGDELYSVKWYKDGREFYRYVPNNIVPISHFATAGVTVDESLSSSTLVALKNLNEESAGMYRCEVSGEAPKFTTVHEDKYITIHYLPKTSPRIMGLKTQYDFGDHAALNCSSPGSRPEAQLKWLINDKSVPKECVRGPWVRISPERTDAMDTTLELRFTVMPKLFKNGVLKIQCQAVIAPLYQEESVYQVTWDNNVYSTMAYPNPFTEENLAIASPVYDTMKDLELPVVDEYSSQMSEDVSKYQTKLSISQDLLFIMMFIRLIL